MEFIRGRRGIAPIFKKCIKSFLCLIGINPAPGDQDPNFEKVGAIPYG